MRVTVLGCGGSAGVPQIGGKDGKGDWGVCDPNEPRNRRSRSSIVMDGGQGRLLVDTGPDVRNQLIDCAIPTIEAVIYTHAHADHIAGMDEIRILNRLVGRPLEIFAASNVLEELKNRFDYAFKPWTTPPHFFRPAIEPVTVEPGSHLDVLGMDVQLIDQNHGYVRSLGLRVGRFAYSTDIAVMEDATLEALRGVDTWMVDCFQRQPHNAHGWVEQVLSWGQQVGAKRTILTHMGYDLDWKWLIKRLPEGFEPAYDGMVIEIE